MNKPPVAPTIGRTVIVTVADHSGKLVQRPGIIVRTWPDGSGGVANYVNVQVFMDGDGTPKVNDGLNNVLWKTSVQYDPEQKLPLSWSWPMITAGPNGPLVPAQQR